MLDEMKKIKKKILKKIIIFLMIGVLRISALSIPDTAI